jgi:hypothetical protein
MSDKVEKMLRVPLSKLGAVRVICKACNKGVLEVPVDRLHAVLDHGDCRLCRRGVLSSSDSDPLDALQKAIEALLQLEQGGKLSVEFEIPSPG